MNMQKLVVASNNSKKRQEIICVLSSLGIDVVPEDQTVFVDVIEDGKTFAENAQKKAEAFMLANHLPALADDSGLCVAVLKGDPGIYSSRFAGACATDKDNNAKLMHELKGKEERSAFFICALHLSLPSKECLTAEGKVEGFILEQLMGDTGFGYDPVFYSPELHQTFAQAGSTEKASVSHRGRALRSFKEALIKSGLIAL